MKKGCFARNTHNLLKIDLENVNFSAKAISIIKSEGVANKKDVNFFENFSNMIYSFKVPLTGMLEIVDVCLPGDMKDTYPPLQMDKLKRDWEESQKQEKTKSRVVYFGDRPQNVRFDALGQPILVASETDTSKSL